MSNATYAKTALIITLAGVLFSGYLSAIKLFTDTCAFSEPCPYFLGYPACLYGFILFFGMCISSLLTLMNRIDTHTGAKILTTLSALGILFAGYFTIPELQKLFFGNGGLYDLGLPTCAYGLIFYILISALSIKYIASRT